MRANTFIPPVADRPACSRLYYCISIFINRSNFVAIFYRPQCVKIPKQAGCACMLIQFAKVVYIRPRVMHERANKCTFSKNFLQNVCSFVDYCHQINSYIFWRGYVAQLLYACSSSQQVVELARCRYMQIFGRFGMIDGIIYMHAFWMIHAYILPALKILPVKCRCC